VNRLVFYHTADLHLGADLNGFSEQAAEKIRAAQYKALQKILFLASEEKAAFVLICGDLFDSRTPSGLTVNLTSEILNNFPEVPVFILPGTHDFADDSGIFACPENLSFGPQTTVLTDAVKSPLCLPDFNCYLHFNINRSNHSAQSPLTGLSRTGNDGFHIALAHGNLGTAGSGPGRDFPIDEKDITNSGFDYIALGHWHKSQNKYIGKTTVAYPGTPQPLSFSDPEAGSVLRVELETGQAARIKAMGTSTVHLARRSGTIYHPDEIEHQLADLDRENTVLKIAFSYSDNMKERSRINQIIKDFSGEFLEMIDENRPELSKSPANKGLFESGGSEPLEMKFLAELELLKAADSADREYLYSKAADLGLSLIRGEK